MRVEELMQERVWSCRTNQSLADALQLMWDHDCGIVPVVDAQRRVIGVVTDRDAAMAAFTRGRTMREIAVGSVVSPRVHLCGGDDAPASALESMREHQVRRLPVVDAHGRLIGVVSLNDLARHAFDSRGTSEPELGLDDVGAALAVISQPRCRRETALATPEPS